MFVLIVGTHTQMGLGGRLYNMLRALCEHACHPPKVVPGCLNFINSNWSNYHPLPCHFDIRRWENVGHSPVSLAVIGKSDQKSRE